MVVMDVMTHHALWPARGPWEGEWIGIGIKTVQDHHLDSSILPLFRVIKHP
jgi:hypothetical protein